MLQTWQPSLGTGCCRGAALLAQSKGTLPPPLPPPTLPSLQAGQHTPVQVLQWTQDQGVAQRLAWRVGECLAQELQALAQPCQGVRDWLAALARASVPCAVVSTLDRHVPHWLDRRIPPAAVPCRACARGSRQHAVCCSLHPAGERMPQNGPAVLAVLLPSPRGFRMRPVDTAPAALLQSHPHWCQRRC